MYKELYGLVLEEHRKVFEAQPQEDLNALMKAVAEADRIFVFGAGREGIAARSFAMRIMHLGKDTFWLLDDTTPGMRVGDLFIAVNGSGKIGYIDYFLDQARKTGAKIAVITGAPTERTPSEADVNVFVPAAVYKGTDPRVVPSKQPMGNLYEQHLFLLFDILVMMLEKKLRETTRYRQELIEERARELNRIQAVLEGCNIKLGSVITDISGKSGIAILKAIISGETDPTVLSGLAEGRARNKLPEMQRALQGRVLEHQRNLLKHQLRHIGSLTSLILDIGEDIKKRQSL